MLWAGTGGTTPRSTPSKGVTWIAQPTQHFPLAFQREHRSHQLMVLNTQTADRLEAGAGDRASQARSQCFNGSAACPNAAADIVAALSLHRPDHAMRP